MADVWWGRANRTWRRLLVVAATVLTLLAASLVSTTAADAAVEEDPAAACAALADLDLGPQVRSITATFNDSGIAEGQQGLPAFCDVRIVVAQMINIATWLPAPAVYNDRLQSVGGGGYAGDISFPAMAAALRDGYATASTDTGHQGGSGAFAFDASGGLNWSLIKDFASRSIFQMTTKTKALIKAYYRASEDYAYWNGCSTGGRQGLMHVQRMPEAYDGVLAEAPAINWDRFVPAETWPQAVFAEEYGDPAIGTSLCKLEAATVAAVVACDTLDGVEDGIIDEPRRCDFDANDLVGEVLDCGEFTAADARAINRIWEGPVKPYRRHTHDRRQRQLWYGLSRGAPLNLIAGSPGVPPFDGPFPIAATHQQWTEIDPTWDWRSLDHREWLENFSRSQKLFNDVIGTDDPDISEFAGAGGKVLIYHGWDDQLIMPEGSIDYYERVIDEFGSGRRVQRFARLFMVPGLWHCGGGPGPDLVDPFAALVAWVEDGDAPDRLAAQQIVDGEVTATRPLCAYPYIARYDGKGDPDEASSYDCKPNYGRPG